MITQIIALDKHETDLYENSADYQIATKRMINRACDFDGRSVQLLAFDGRQLGAFDPEPDHGDD